MGLTNFIVTVAGVSALVLVMRSDVKQTATVFRRNVRQIRHWLEHDSSTVAKEAKSKELPEKDTPKGDKH